MSYIRNGHKLHWFDDESTEYVFPCSDNAIEDYGSNYDHLPSLVELIGNIVFRETKDFSYATKLVVVLAHKLRISHKLRADNFPHEEITNRVGQDYRAELERCGRYLQGCSSNTHYPDDEISDFGFLDTFEDEEELFDVEKNMDGMIEEAEIAVLGVIDKLDLPCPITIDATFFRWSGCDEGYEFGVDLKFDEMFTSESFKEENEIQKVEDAIEKSGVLKHLEKRVGKIEVCCYIPFDVMSLNDTHPTTP
jgi:hypothetical protein